MTIQAITFDFWSTLYHYIKSPRGRQRRYIQAALATIGRDDLTEEQLVAGMKHGWDRWEHIWRTEHRTPGASEWLQSVLDHIDVTMPAAIFEQTADVLKRSVLSESTVPIEGVPQALAWLSKRYRLGIISDTGLATGQVLRALLQRDGLLSYFSHLVFSDEFGHSKPDPAVFHAALGGLNAQPHEAVHIGDLRHTDIFGARGVGMGTIRYAGVRDDCDADYAEADVVARSYDEVLQYFTEREL